MQYKQATVGYFAPSTEVNEKQGAPKSCRETDIV